MQAESKIKMEERCLRQTGLPCKGKYSTFHFPGMTWKAVQRAPEDASPSRALVMARIWHFPEAYFSIHLQVWNGRRRNTFKSCCTLNIASLALMFVAFICLERFSKFPVLCTGRVGFVSAWLGSKQHALALLLRRREERFRGRRSREMWAAACGTSANLPPRRGRVPAGRGRGGGADRALCRSPAELRPGSAGLGSAGAGAGASQRLRIEPVRSAGLQRFSPVPVPVALSSVSPECPISALRVLLCVLVCEQSHGLQCN